MSIPALLSFLLWFCFVLSVLTIGALTALLFTLAKDSANELVGSAAVTSVALIAMVSASCTLVLSGHPIPALWLWRVVSVLLFIFSLRACIGAFGKDLRAYRTSFFESATAARVFTIAASVGVLFFLMTSLLVPALPNVNSISPYPQPSSAVTATPPAAAIAAVPSLTANNPLDLSHLILYAILSVACVVFGMLFIIASRREGPLSFERNGGGLGGSTGGWEVSNSLTYLLATIASGTLLLFFIFHNDQLQKDKDRHEISVGSNADNGKSAAQSVNPAAGKTETPAVTPPAIGKEAGADKPLVKPGEHPNAD